MAHKTGSLGKLIVPAYYSPTEQAHSTPGAIFSRLEEIEGRVTFKDGPQREQADSSLLMGHNIVLNVLELQKEEFGLDALAQPLQECFQDFLDIWGKSSKEDAPSK
jgi:hypothetical protein